MKGARRKRDTAKHDIAMLDVGRRRQALGESIRNHKVGAKRNETKNLEAHKSERLSVDKWFSGWRPDDVTA
jgi:hypothetical protein